VPEREHLAREPGTYGICLPRKVLSARSEAGDSPRERTGRRRGEAEPLTGGGACESIDGELALVLSTEMLRGFLVTAGSAS